MHSSIDKKLACISGAFPLVAASAANGAEFVASQLELAHTAKEREEWLVLLPETIEVVATDDSGSDTKFLKIFLIPDRRPVVIFFTPAHKEASIDLLKRLEATLGESADLWPASTPLSSKRRPVL